MNRKEYSTREVEEMLRELARQNGGLMDDAMSKRLLAVLHAEADRVFRRRYFRAVLPWAAVLVGCAVAAGLLLPGDDAQMVPGVAESSASVRRYTGEMRLAELENPESGDCGCVPNMVYRSQSGGECGIACPAAFDIEVYNIPL